MELEVGKTYHLLAGIRVNTGGEVLADVIYLSNMVCIGATEDKYTLKGAPGSVGSLRGPISVYKDEIFSVFDKDLFTCLNH